MDLGTHSLLPGERLLWEGRPERFPLRAMDWYTLAFGAVWMGIVSVGIFAADGVFPTFFPTVFLLIGFAGTWGRVIVAQIAARSTTYQLTDRRVLAVSTRPRYRERSEYLERLAPPVLKPGPQGTGTFAATSGMKRNPVGGGPMAIELCGIPEAQRVRDLIANAQANSR